MLIVVARRVAHLHSLGVRTNTINAEIVGAFLFWASPRRRFGLYAEPAYATDLRQDHASVVAGLAARS